MCLHGVVTGSLNVCAQQIHGIALLLVGVTPFKSAEAREHTLSATVLAAWKLSPPATCCHMLTIVHAKLFMPHCLSMLHAHGETKNMPVPCANEHRKEAAQNAPLTHHLCTKCITHSLPQSTLVSVSTGERIPQAFDTGVPGGVTPRSEDSIVTFVNSACRFLE